MDSTGGGEGEGTSSSPASSPVPSRCSTSSASNSAYEDYPRSRRLIVPRCFRRVNKRRTVEIVCLCLVTRSTQVPCSSIVCSSRERLANLASIGAPCALYHHSHAVMQSHLLGLGRGLPAFRRENVMLPTIYRSFWSCHLSEWWRYTQRPALPRRGSGWLVFVFYEGTSTLVLVIHSLMFLYQHIGVVQLIQVCGRSRCGLRGATDLGSVVYVEEKSRSLAV